MDEGSIHSELEEHKQASGRAEERIEELASEIEDDEGLLAGEPLPPDAPRNWTALVAIVSLAAGFAIGFVVPVIGFAFYILAGFVSLIFSIASLIMFRKYGIPAPTIGALICSIFLLGWGIFHAVTFASTAMAVVSLIEDGGAMLGALAGQAGVQP